MTTDPIAEALEAGIAALDQHYTAFWDGTIPECRCGSREDDHDAKVVVAAVAPILLAAGRTAAAAAIRQYVKEWDAAKNTGAYSKGLHAAARIAERTDR